MRWRGLWCVCFLSVNAAYAAPKYDSFFYYKIGGADRLSVAPSPVVSRLRVSLRVQTALLNCGKFDPMLSIRHSLDNLKEGTDAWINQIETAASAAITALPGYILQKANPGLYNLFQNGLLRAGEEFRLSTKTCENIMYELGQGKDPFEEWVSISAGEDWRYAMGTAGITDINAAKQKIDQDRGKQGVSWVGGQKRGGVGQAPIRVISDVVKAGYNLSLGRIANDETPYTRPTPTTILPEMVKTWRSPQAVQNWTEDVLGEVIVSTCEETGCMKATIPGKGLLPKISDRAVTVKEQLDSLVANNIPATQENLREIATPGMDLSGQVIEAIQRLVEDEAQDDVTRQLSSEIAESLVISEALTVRRLLLTGKKEGNVQSIGIAEEEVDQAVAEIEQEMESLLFEKRVRDAFVTDTALDVLSHATAKEMRSLRIDNNVPHEPYPYRDGYVHPEPVEEP